MSTPTLVTDLDQLSFSQDYATLPGKRLYSYVKPQGLSNPRLVIANDALAEELGIAPEALRSNKALAYCSGNAEHPDWQPLAMKYTGHQFGVYNPDLGDGRGLLMGDSLDTQGRRQDWHLKGAGKTPYSRFADGRAVLRSSIREYIASLAMHALGVPTTRALTLVTSDTQVAREEIEPGAMLMRIAPTHIRFGHFEYLYHSHQMECLKQLADYTIHRLFPEIPMGQPHTYTDWFAAIIDRTAYMVAKWLSVGFIHGVMNTDNFAISGETFDYGPYGFMHRYQPQRTPNHTDQQGRYQFDQQANIAYWNLAALRHALQNLVGDDTSQTLLETFPETFFGYYQNLQDAKLGFPGLSDDDSGAIKELHRLTLINLENNQFDMTTFYRELAQFTEDNRRNQWRENARDLEAFDTWWTAYDTILKQQLTDNNPTFSDERRDQMNAANPAIIPRNSIIQQCIDAAEDDDFAPLAQYCNALSHPYSDNHPAVYRNPIDDHAENRPLSCSS